MKATVLTEETQLRIWNIDDVVAFARAGQEALVRVSAAAERISVTPGSLSVSDSEKDGLYEKKLTFRVPEDSKKIAIMLESLRMRHIIAVYRDERGVDRVAGSPTWPARLAWSRSGGSIEVTVTAAGDTPNLRISGSSSPLR